RPARRPGHRPPPRAPPRRDRRHCWPALHPPRPAGERRSHRSDKVFIRRTTRVHPAPPRPTVRDKEIEESRGRGMKNDGAHRNRGRAGQVRDSLAPAADHDREHEMRESFHEDLEKFSAAVVDMTNQASAALERATHALLDADVTLAETVISSSEGPIRDACLALEDKAVDLLARESPVAGDLRLIVAGLRGMADLDRMAGLAAHIAKIARLRYPGCAVPDVL